MLALLKFRSVMHSPAGNRLFDPKLQLHRLRITTGSNLVGRLFNTKHNIPHNNLAAQHTRLFSTSKENLSMPGNGKLPNTGNNAWHDPEFNLWLFGRSKYLMAASVGYATLDGWTYGLGLLGYVFFSELGRALAIKHLNVPSLTVLRNPLSSTSTSTTDLVIMEKPRSAEERADIAFFSAAGGLGAAFGTGFLGVAMGSQDLVHLCAVGYTVSAVNFIMPIAAFDGDKFWPHLPTPNWWLQSLTYFGVLGVCFVENVDPVFRALVLGSAYFGYDGWKDKHSRGNFNWRQFNWREYMRCAVAFLWISGIGNALHHVMNNVCPESLHYELVDLPTYRTAQPAAVVEETGKADGTAEGPKDA